jgi:hypothetical protein
MRPPSMNVENFCVSVAMTSKPGSPIQNLPYSNFSNYSGWSHVNLAIPQ